MQMAQVVLFYNKTTAKTSTYYLLLLPEPFYGPLELPGWAGCK